MRRANRTEQVTFELCKKTFLSLWSYPTPLRGDGKELCDILVVSEPNIIVFSVKEIEYRDNKPEPIAQAKWQRKAVDDSVKQIYKAEKWIFCKRPILSRDKKPMVLSDLKDWRIHRIAVALGSKDKTPIHSGDFGRGYVHVHDELSIHALTRELDTITDFVNYLDAVESLVSRSIVNLEAGEENLLASYLYNGRSLPNNPTVVVIPDGNWSSFESREEVKLRRSEDRISYLWDGIIETFSKNLDVGTLSLPAKPGETELVLRAMAKENRFNRRLLSTQMDDMLRNTPTTEGRARMLQSPSGIVYVFLIVPKEVPLTARREQLQARCFVARDLLRSASTVIGIATEHSDAKSGFIDTCYLHYPDWTNELHKYAQQLQQSLGYFASAPQRRVQVDEYPSTTDELGEASIPLDPNAANFEFLTDKYPLTSELATQSPKFRVLGNQLQLEGYENWQILGGLCSLVMDYRIDHEAKIPRSENARVKSFVDGYVETPYSLFLSFDKLALKQVRDRIHTNLAPIDIPNSIPNGNLEGPVWINGINREPENVLYVRTQDNFDLWTVYFPDYHTKPGTISISDQWYLRIGCDCNDSLSHRLAKELAHDIAKYAGMVDSLLDGLESTRKKELSISVLEEGLMRKQFQDSYLKALKGRAGIGQEALVLAWRSLDDKPHMKLGINEEIGNQSRMKRLTYALTGLLICISGLSQDEASLNASEFVDTLE